MDLPVAAHFDGESFGERVDDGDADAVQAAGDLIARAAELAAGVQLRQHDGERGHALVLHDVDGDARAPVLDRDGMVGVKRHLDAVVAVRERLVDGVVDHLVDEMVETAEARRTDVHPGPEPHRLEPLQNGDVLSGVGAVCFRLRH